MEMGAIRRTMPGQFVYIEIPADDNQKVREFYGSLFGWEFQQVPGPAEYHTTSIGDQQGAAVTSMEPGRRGARSYFVVDEIKTSAARVKELGGDATDPMAIPSLGWFSNCADPHGNEFGLWEVDASATASQA
jgi:predicted enzyme related to lactoylglutathione lyase